jgi:hypothetical protein
MPWFNMQGENIIHGLVCRIEDMLCPDVKEGQQQQLNEQLFGLIHNMLDHATNSFKVRVSSLSPHPGHITACCNVARLFLPSRHSFMPGFYELIN